MNIKEATAKANTITTAELSSFIKEISTSAAINTAQYNRLRDTAMISALCHYIQSTAQHCPIDPNSTIPHCEGWNVNPANCVDCIRNNPDKLTI